MIHAWISRPLDFSSPPTLRHYLINWAEGIGYVDTLDPTDLSNIQEHYTLA